MLATSAGKTAEDVGKRYRGSGAGGGRSCCVARSVAAATGLARRPRLRPLRRRTLGRGRRGSLGDGLRRALTIGQHTRRRSNARRR